MESRDVLKIHGALRRYCTSRVLLRSTLEVQYLLNLPCIFNTSLDSMLYLLNLKVNFELYALIVRLKNYEGRSIFFLLQTNREVIVDLTNKHSIPKANQVILHHLLWQ